MRLNTVTGDKGSTVTSVCGEVNAKNSMGAYTGSEPFAYIRAVTDKLSGDRLYTHHIVGETVLQDGNDSISKMHGAVIGNLCGSSTDLSEADVLYTSASLEQKRTGYYEKQQAMWDWVHAQEGKRERALNSQSTSQPASTPTEVASGADDSANTTQ